MRQSETRNFKDTAWSHLASIGKALSSPARLEILELISQSSLTVEAIAATIDQSVANTSHHLQALKRAHLVKSARDGVHVSYSLAGDDVASLLGTLQEVATTHIAELQQLTQTFFSSRDQMERVDRETLVERLRASEVVLLDVRPEHEYDAKHLPDALSVPLHTLESRLADLPKDKPIVAYCRGPFCTLSAAAAQRLRDLGYDARRTDVSVNTLTNQEHWDAVYADKPLDGVSWYRPHLDQSLEMIDEVDLPKDAQIVDVGGGAATLVDDLLEDGFENLAVLDISLNALNRSAERLGKRSRDVRWIVGDASTNHFAESSVDLWHDRAVFHFMTDPNQRDAYLCQVKRSVRPGGYALISTFAPDGPDKCSGLRVRQHTPAEIAEALGPDFELVDQAREEHKTPWGSTQVFSYALCRRR